MNAIQSNIEPNPEHSVFIRKGMDLASLSDSSYVFLDMNGKVLEASPCTVAMLGYATDDLKGHSFFANWVVPNMGKALMKQVIHDKVLRKFVADMKHENGSVVVISINARFIMDETRRTAGIECLISDVTDLQQKENGFEETLRNVTGGIAHLINNQMTAVVGTADLIKMQLWDRPDLAEKLDRITASGLQAGEVAHTLAAYSEKEEVKSKQRIDLNCIIAAISRDYKQHSHEEKPRQLSFDIASDIAPVLGSEREYSKLLNCMLDNAIEATKNGDKITISTKNVPFSRQSTGEQVQHVMLSIEDSGHGMDRETQHRIFEPFFSTRFQGRGMSMAYVLKTIEKLDGHIHVESSPDQGSCFTMHFPACLV